MQVHGVVKSWTQLSHWIATTAKNWNYGIQRWKVKEKSSSSCLTLICVWLFVNPWTEACQASLSITSSWNLLILMFIDSVRPSNHLILCCPLPLLPSIFPSIKSFLMSEFFTSGGQSIGVSASASVLPVNIQAWFPLVWLVWSPCSPSDSQESSPVPQFKSINSSVLSFLYSPSLTPYIATGKTIALTRWTFVGKVMSLLFNMLSRLVIAFLSRSKCLLILWLQSPSAVILEPKKIKSLTVSIVFPSICHEVMGPDGMILVFWMLSFKSTFSLSFFTFNVYVKEAKVYFKWLPSS